MICVLYPRGFGSWAWPHNQTTTLLLVVQLWFEMVGYSEKKTNNLGSSLHVDMRPQRYLVMTGFPTFSLQELSIAYGEYLAENNRQEEAGLGIHLCYFLVLVQSQTHQFCYLMKTPFAFFSVFTRCGAHGQALTSFQKSGNWRQVFCMASLLHYTKEQVISLARSVAGIINQSLSLPPYSVTQFDKNQSGLRASPWENERKEAKEKN